MNRLKKIITCIMIMALTVTILNAQVADQTSVRAEAKNKYTGAVTLSNREKSEFQKVINGYAKKKLATNYKEAESKKYRLYEDYTIIKLGTKNVLILTGDTSIYTTSGRLIRLYYLDNNKVKSIDTAGERNWLAGYNKYDGSIAIGFYMGQHPIWSEKISKGKIKAYNKLCKDAQISIDKYGYSYNDKIISKKKFKQLNKKYYSNVCDIKMLKIQKNNTIKKSYNCVTNKKLSEEDLYM